MRVGIQTIAAPRAARSTSTDDVTGATPTQTSEFARQLRANKATEPGTPKSKHADGEDKTAASAAHKKASTGSGDASAAAAGAGAIPQAVQTLSDAIDAAASAAGDATATAVGVADGKPAVSPAALGANTTASSSPAPADAAASQNPAAASSLAAASESAAAATPLEQAVHELLAGLPGYDGKADKPKTAAPTAATTALSPTTGASTAPAADAPKPAAPAAPIAPPTPQAENANPSHVHLVLDDGGDGGQRVVMTVAVRGSEVNVALRSSDDHTATALARNASALDDAMRSRGLELGHLASEHDRAGADKQSHRSPARDADRRSQSQSQPSEPFELEENV